MSIHGCCLRYKKMTRQTARVKFAFFLNQSFVFDGWHLPVSNSDMQSESYNHLQITGYRDLIASSRDGSC